MSTANENASRGIANARRCCQQPAVRRLPAHRFHPREKGLSATIVLYTLALILLVGAVFAYATRGNASANNSARARVYATVMLKQSADFRDAYSRYVFDRGNAATMTFHTTDLSTDLFNTTAQYGIYQAPPQQAMTSTGTAAWLYNRNVFISGVGTAGAETVTYVLDVTAAVCSEINNQLYGSASIPSSRTVQSSAVGNPGTIFDATPIGRSTGCFKTADSKYVVYSTLGES